MKYRDALKRTAVALATNWRHVPGNAVHAWREFLPFANTLLILLALIVSPLLVVFSPLLALWRMADERQRKRNNEAAIKRMNEHYGSRRQKL